MLQWPYIKLWSQTGVLRVNIATFTETGTPLVSDGFCALAEL